MKILAVDIGTGTQDILYWDTQLAPENASKLVIPAPTLLVHGEIKRATRRGEAILLEGRTMGGGPSQWAAEAHIRAGGKVFATAAAGRSFNDDLRIVEEEMGIRILSEDEARSLPPSVRRIRLGDFDFEALAHAFAGAGMAIRPDLIALAAFDHGNAPVGTSDRQFRFDYLATRIGMANRLSTFAFRVQEVPAIMTRLAAIAESARGAAEHILVMDSAPAAVLGALQDPRAGEAEAPLVANLGNFHVLAFRLRRETAGFEVEGLFEHHTGLVTRRSLEELLEALAAGRLVGGDVFAAGGHGALMLTRVPLRMGAEESPLVIVGPRRAMLRASRLAPYLAAPYGDMMLAGAYGLVRAAADIFPELGAHILEALGGTGDRAPWEASEL